jgi:hypothetical protein
MAKTGNEMKQVADVASGPVDSAPKWKSPTFSQYTANVAKRSLATRIAIAPTMIPPRVVRAGKVLTDKLVRGWKSNRATSKRLKKAVDVSRGR